MLFHFKMLHKLRHCGNLRVFIPASDAVCCFRIASATGSIWDARRAIPLHSVDPAPGRPAAKDPRWGAAQCTRWAHFAGRRRAQARSMDLPFTRSPRERLRGDYDPYFLVIGFVAFALIARSAHAAGNDYPTSARADYVIG